MNTNGTQIAKKTVVDGSEKAKLLRERLPQLYDLLDPCRLCPRECLVHRTKGELGICGIANELIISSIGLHHGNEYPISGYRGSGNIFLSGCNLKCVYCQNWTISVEREGRKMSTLELAGAMLSLEKAGAHNINCVSPTHMVPMLMEALQEACRDGLELPLVYNTGGYDSLEVLRLLEGIVDIYLPDMKYGDATVGLELSGIKEYPFHNQAAVREMHRQVGPLQYDEHGVAVHGLLVRHLVLPGDSGGSEKIFDFLERELEGPVDVNVMGQYCPCYKAADYPAIARSLKQSEFLSIVEKAKARKKFRLVED